MGDFKIGDFVIRKPERRQPYWGLGDQPLKVTVIAGKGRIQVEGSPATWKADYFDLAPQAVAVDQHAPGAKLDTGKIRPGLVLGGFARALKGVSEVGTFGAAKYTDNGWTEVPNGEARYEDAQLRHWLDSKAGIPTDPESHLIHLKHEAWNALARLDLHLRNEEKKNAEAS